MWVDKILLNVAVVVPLQLFNIQMCSKTIKIEIKKKTMIQENQNQRVKVKGEMFVRKC